jgi:hypothetical protein
VRAAGVELRAAGVELRAAGVELWADADEFPTAAAAAAAAAAVTSVRDAETTLNPSRARVPTSVSAPSGTWYCDTIVGALSTAESGGVGAPGVDVGCCDSDVSERRRCG